jgi:hypothetical protein
LGGNILNSASNLGITTGVEEARTALTNYRTVLTSNTASVEEFNAA